MDLGELLSATLHGPLPNTPVLGMSLFIIAWQDKEKDSLDDIVF